MWRTYVTYTHGFGQPYTRDVHIRFWPTLHMWPYLLRLAARTAAHTPHAHVFDQPQLFWLHSAILKAQCQAPYHKLLKHSAILKAQCHFESTVPFWKHRTIRFESTVPFWKHSTIRFGSTVPCVLKAQCHTFWKHSAIRFGSTVPYGSEAQCCMYIPHAHQHLWKPLNQRALGLLRIYTRCHTSLHNIA